MALFPDTPETRVLPGTGNTFRERRLIRGVGAQERALGNSYARLSSWDKERYGSQKNYAKTLKNRATDIEADRLRKQDEAVKQAGRDSIASRGDSEEVLGPLRQQARKASLGLPTSPSGSSGSSGSSAGASIGSIIGNAVAQAVTPQSPSATPAARKPVSSSPLVTHMGRQYPANIVGDPSKRMEHDRAIDTRLTEEAQSRNGYKTKTPLNPEEIFAQRRKASIDKMKVENPGKYARMAQAEAANGGKTPKNWQDQPDMEDAVKSGRVKMS